eukprot:TRINITY_DN5384_c0_g1_i1.p1 TRINITY_DN5384_c0_g1~~TRINITY_DN5384_c0_g1_i1.p1  ORF type:complete len:669 (+),score=180.63 TRINITY_DN5384_c0_g1_i1:48-2009(+)
MAAAGSHLGYLWRAGDRLNFRWSTEPVPGAFAQLTPAPGIKGWELKGATTELKSNANLPKELFAGLSNFFRFARKKGIMITWLQPVAKVALYFGEGLAIKNLITGDSFDVGTVDCAGFIDADSEQIDDLHEKKNFSKGMFTNAILEAKGESVDLSDLPVLKQGANNAPPAQTAASQSQAPKVTEEIQQKTREPAAALSGQGCYLVVEKAGAGQAQAITVVCRWSKVFVEGSVGFFDPSLDKVPTTSWKYNNGGTRVVLMSGTSAARGAPAKYYEAWISFLNEARKMGGKFTMLPAEDPTYSTMVMFQQEASEKLFHAKPGEPQVLLDKALGFVCNDSEENQFFNVSSMSPAIILAEGKKNGALCTWTVDPEVVRRVQATETSPRKSEAAALRERAAAALGAELKIQEERKAREAAEAAEAARKIEEDHKAKEAAEAAEAASKAEEERQQKAAAEAFQRERQAEEDRKAREAAEAAEVAHKVEEERKQKEAAEALERERKAEEERKAREAAEAAEVARKVEEERKRKEAAETLERERKADEERKVREGAARKAEEERKAAKEAANKIEEPRNTPIAICSREPQNTTYLVHLQDFEHLVTRLQMATEKLVPGTAQKPVATAVAAPDAKSIPAAIDLRGFEALVASMERSAARLGL